MKRDTSVNVRLTSELRQRLQKLADADGRTLSAYIERVLRQHAEAAKPAPEPPTELPPAEKKKR
jgi:predicted DNA-binding protein